MTGMSMPKHLRDIVDNSKGVAASDGFEQIRVLLLEYSNVSDTSARGLQRYFRSYPAIPGNQKQTLTAHMAKWRVLRERLKEMKYKQNRLDCIDSLVSMTAHIPDCVLKHKDMETRLDIKTNDKLNLEDLINEFDAIAKNLASDHHVRSELADGGKVHVATTDTEDYKVKKTKKEKREEAKALKAAAAPPMASSPEQDCFHWMDFGFCNKIGAGCIRPHLPANKNLTEKESHYNGLRICPYHRRTGVCRSGNACKMLHLKDGVPQNSEPSPAMQPMANAAIMGQPLPTATVAQQQPLVDQDAIRDAVRAALPAALAAAIKGMQSTWDVYVQKCKLAKMKRVLQRLKAHELGGDAVQRSKVAMVVNNIPTVIVDSGANVMLIGNQDRQQVSHQQHVTHPGVAGIVGSVEVKTKGKVTVMDTAEAETLISESNMESVCPVASITAGRRSVLFDTKGSMHVVEGEVDIPPQLDYKTVQPGSDGLFRVPITPALRGDDLPNVCNVCTVSVAKEMSEDEYVQHTRKGHPFDPRCEICVRSYMTKRPANRREPNETHSDEEHGAVLGIDTVDNLPTDLRKCTDVLIGTESKSDWGGVYGMTSKSGTEVVAGVKHFEAELRRMSHGAVEIVRVHSDAAKELNKGVFKTFSMERGWNNTNTGGYRPNANSKTERYVRMLFEKLRAALLTATGGHSYFDKLWGVGLEYAADVLMRLPRSTKHGKSGKSSFENLTGAPYTWDSDDHVFGAYVYNFVVKEHRQNKASPTAERAIWVGRDRMVPGGHSIVPITWDMRTDSWFLHEPVIATSVKVNDRVFPLRLGPKTDEDAQRFEAFVDKFDPPSHNHASQRMDQEPTKDELHEMEAILGVVQTKTLGPRYIVKWRGYRVPTRVSRQDIAEYGGHEMLAEFDAEQTRIHEEKKVEREIAKSKQRLSNLKKALRKRKAKKAVVSLRAFFSKVTTRDDAEKAINECMKRQKNLPGTPVDYVEGYKAELQNVISRRLRELVGEERDRIARQKIAIKLRMILEAKRDGRKKGRLIIQGFREPLHWDVGGTDSPVANLSTVRTQVFRSNTCKITGKQRELSMCDVSVAFLQSDDFGENDHLRYVLLKEHRNAPDRLFQLLGPLYGQRSASRRWHKTIKAWLVQQGYTPGCNEPCVFHNAKTDHTVVLWVDDILSNGTREVSDAFYAALKERFEVKTPEYLADDNPLDFVSFVITQKTTTDGVHRYIDQERAVASFVNEYGPGTVTPSYVTCPMPNKHAINQHPELLEGDDVTLYKSKIGACNYFVSTLRYDIAYAISRLGQLSAKPTVGAMRALDRVIQYLGETVAFCIGGRLSKTEDVLRFQSDSDHGGDRPLSRKSQSGMMFTLNGVPIHWKSNKQPTTTDSSAAAEIYALSQAYKEARYYTWKCEEMGMRVPSQVCMEVDNTQAISFQNRTCPHTKLKGVFDLRWDWVCDLQRAGEVKTVYVDTKYNMADLLTKCLDNKQFNRLVQLTQRFNDRVIRLVQLAKASVCEREENKGVSR